jgi:hypothetical protein
MKKKESFRSSKRNRKKKILHRKRKRENQNEGRRFKVDCPLFFQLKITGPKRLLIQKKKKKKIKKHHKMSRQSIDVLII